MKYIMPKRKDDRFSAVPDIVTDETVNVPSRVANRKLSEENVNLTDIDGVLNSVYEIIGVTDTTIVAKVSPAQIDLMAEELVAVRNAKDLIEGRESALKSYATEIINYRISQTGDDPLTKSGFLVSPDNGIKISKEVSGGKLTVDPDVLKTILDEEQFKSVTNKVTTHVTIECADGSVEMNKSIKYEINEEALEGQLALGAIGMEQIVKAALPGKTKTAVYVRKLK
jgi:hypothetical protein